MLASLLLLSAPVAPIAMNYGSMRGLNVQVAGVPVVRGSYFQFYQPGWKEVYYSSLWRPQTVTRSEQGAVVVRFESLDRRCAGSQIYTPTPWGFRAEYEFKWKGTKPAKLECALALIWSPSIEHGALAFGGLPGPAMTAPPPENASVAKRILGRRSRSVEFDAPFAKIMVRSTLPNLVLYDARNYRQIWADAAETFWLGHMDLDLRPDETLRFVTEWVVEVKDPPTAVGGSEVIVPTYSLTPQHSASVVVPPTSKRVLLPKPKQMTLSAGKGCLADQGFAFDIPPGCEAIREAFLQRLSEKWELPPPTGPPTPIRATIENLRLPEEGYEIVVSPEGVSIKAQSRRGLRHAFGTLAQLPASDNQSLRFPVVKIRDWPSVQFRGVHLFVGPTASEFQQRLFSRVLVPLKFNAAVIQCERTNWLATPGIETHITMPRDALKAHFDFLRSLEIEPIPLIQSFGHMNWLFANGKNLDLAINRESPHAIDPRRASARRLLEALWDEAIALLQPKIVHFGLDEVDQRGWTDDPFLTDRLWTEHVPFLAGIARKHGVQMMLWGDQCLTRSEAPDAAHGDSPNHAAVRRAAIPKGTWIGDWHYKPSPDPKVFKSLELWKREGMVPIATSWFRPSNIRGHTLAAIAAGCGTLQTTWAGYESSEANMLREFDQFAALILAGDYAWSGRQELPTELPYRPGDVLRALFYDQPAVTAFQPGALLARDVGSSRRRIGTVEYLLFEPIQLRDVLAPGGWAWPNQVTLQTDAPISHLALALDVRNWVGEQQEIAEVEARLSDGSAVVLPIRYGLHVRAQRDGRAVLQAERGERMCSVRLAVGDGKVRLRRLIIRSKCDYAGLRIAGVSTY